MFSDLYTGGLRFLLEKLVKSVLCSRIPLSINEIRIKNGIQELSQRPILTLNGVAHV